MNWVYKILSSTLILTLLYYIARWYMLVYKTKYCFADDNTKSIEAIYYEEIFMKVIQFTLVSAFFMVMYIVYRKYLRRN